MQDKSHWEHVYTSKKPDAASWYQQHAGNSLDLIQRTGIASDAAIIDVGGGASILIDDLLRLGYSDLTYSICRQRLLMWRASGWANWPEP